MKGIRQSFSIAGYNFRLWRGNPRILVTFLLAFILCFLLSDKAVTFAVEHNTTMQLVEVFIWNFGDSNSILLSSVLLVLLFADMPFLSAGTPLYLVRTKRRIWITGQAIYILAATFVYLLFVLVCTVFFSMRQSFTANIWSPTAAILGYTNAGERVAIPALVKTLEMSWPYQSIHSLNIFLADLSPETRKIFLKRYWELKPIKEISSTYGITDGKVKITLLRTREKLKRFLCQEGYFL